MGDGHHHHGHGTATATPRPRAHAPRALLAPAAPRARRARDRRRSRRAGRLHGRRDARHEIEISPTGDDESAATRTSSSAGRRLRRRTRPCSTRSWTAATRCGWKTSRGARDVASPAERSPSSTGAATPRCARRLRRTSPELSQSPGLLRGPCRIGRLARSRSRWGSLRVRGRDSSDHRRCRGAQRRGGRQTSPRRVRTRSSRTG